MNKRKIAKRGEIWSINDRKTRGHNSIIVQGNAQKSSVLHIPITHAETTRNMRNIDLFTNPNKQDPKISRVIPKVQKSHEKSLGRKNTNIIIKDPRDKSIIRHIKKNKKR